jgi:integrase
MAMSDPVFRSKLGPSIEVFISQKRASGYPYITSARILGYLNSLIADKFPNSNTLTKEICDIWIAECSYLHQNTLLRRVTPVRQYAKYLIGTGTKAYIIPGRIPGKQIHYDAHIFTERELTAFFTAINQCPRSPFSPLRCYVIPVFFRLLYTCGLRSSEARCLKVEDVDLDTGKVFIKKSKGWEARIIYVSDDLLDLLCRYNTIINKVLPGREAFFPNREGDYYSTSMIDVWFHEFWDQLPEAAEAKGNKPRVHDFRHSYCVYRLNQWVRENKDLNALYPYLSEFVGHSNFADTDYYLTLAEPFYPEFQKRMSSVNARILPEVAYEN